MFWLPFFLEASSIVLFFFTDVLAFFCRVRPSARNGSQLANVLANLGFCVPGRNQHTVVSSEGPAALASGVGEPVPESPDQWLWGAFFKTDQVFLIFSFVVLQHAAAQHVTM
jgi:hypothetical protein